MSNVWHLETRTPSYIMESAFLEKFNPSDESHVLWFSDMIKVARIFTSVDLTTYINTNPMKIDFDANSIFGWPNIHCLLGMKYASAVLEGNAFIPKKVN